MENSPSKAVGTPSALAILAIAARAGRPINEFAKLIGVSNNTVRKVESGKFEAAVADLRSKPTSRKYKAKIDVIARFAIACGDDPNKWLAAAALEKDATIIEIARKQVQRHATAPHLRRTVNSIEVIKRNGGVVKTYVFPCGPFADLAKKEVPESSFIHRYVKSLCSLIEPDWKPQFVDFDTIQSAKNAWDQDPEAFQLGVGGFLRLPGRRIRDIDFVKIPGWSVPLAALGIRAKGKIEWSDIIRGATGNAPFRPICAIVSNEGVGELYLRQRRSESRIVRIDTYPDPAKMMAAIAKEVEKYPRFDVVFVTDVMVARTLYRFAGRSSLQAIDLDVHEPVPSYSVAMAIRYGDDEWKELLSDVQRDDMFSSAAAETVNLYASFLEQLVNDDWNDHVPNCLSLKLSPFGPTMIEFERRLMTRFHAIDSERLTARLCDMNYVSLEQIYNLSKEILAKLDAAFPSAKPPTAGHDPSSPEVS